MTKTKITCLRCEKKKQNYHNTGYCQGCYYQKLSKEYETNKKLCMKCNNEVVVKGLCMNCYQKKYRKKNRKKMLKYQKAYYKNKRGGEEWNVHIVIKSMSYRKKF